MSLHRNTKYGLIFLIVLSLISMSTIIHDNKQRPLADQLQPVDKDGIGQFQQISDDWTQLNSELFTIDGTGFIVDTSISPELVFQVGDKLRITTTNSITDEQGISHAYLSSIDENRIAIITSTDDLMNDVLNKIELSRGLEPAGFTMVKEVFVGVFDHYPIIDPNTDPGYALLTGQFYMVGSVAHLNMHLELTTDAGGSVIYFGLPADINTDTATWFAQPAVHGNDGANIIVKQYFQAVNYMQQTFYFGTISIPGDTWPAATAITSDINISYLTQ